MSRLATTGVKEHLKDGSKGAFATEHGATEDGLESVVRMILYEAPAADERDGQCKQGDDQEGAEEPCSVLVAFDGAIQCGKGHNDAKNPSDCGEYLDEYFFCPGGGFRPRYDAINQHSDDGQCNDQGEALKQANEKLH